MSSHILNKLQEFQKQSNKQLNKVVMSGLHDHSKPRALVQTVMIANGQFAVKPVQGSSSLLSPKGRQSKRKVKIFTPGTEQLTNKSNKELLGGENYPILTATAGIAAGVVSGGAGLFFTLATTGMTLARTTSSSFSSAR